MKTLAIVLLSVAITMSLTMLLFTVEPTLFAYRCSMLTNIGMLIILLVRTIRVDA